MLHVIAFFHPNNGVTYKVFLNTQTIFNISIGRGPHIQITTSTVLALISMYINISIGLRENINFDVISMYTKEEYNAY